MKMNKELEYLEKLNKRQKQKFKIFANNPTFQADVADIRKKWKIPENGLKPGNEILRWSQKLGSDTDDFYKIKWPKYRSELDALRKKNYFEFEKRQEEINLLAPINAFNQDYYNIIIKYNLPPKWKEGIKTYILSGEERMFIGPVIHKQFDKDTQQDLLFIQIDDDTTKEDIVNMWHLVKIHQKGLVYRKQDKYQPIPNYERYKRAYDLKQEGKKAKEIADIMGTFDKPLSENDIYEYIRQYKQISGINPS